jgi:hypothetical protein
MKKTWIAWIISLALTVVCMLINYFRFRVEHIIQLEFASNAQQMHDCIMRIADNNPQYCYHILWWNTAWDYGFLLAYSLLTLFSFIIFLDVFQLVIRPWVYVLSFITGMLDAVENYFLLCTGSLQQEQFSGIYYWAVRIKWGFAIIPILLIMMVILYGILQLLRMRKSS